MKQLQTSQVHKTNKYMNYKMKDRFGDQRGGSEWEPIKILLEGD
jgi:hypothetical protein